MPETENTTLNAAIEVARRKFPSFTDKPLAKAGFWCKHGFHRTAHWGDIFRTLDVCVRCGKVTHTITYFDGMGTPFSFPEVIGYIDPAETRKRKP